MNQEQAVDFVRACRRTKQGWNRIATALMALEVTPQQLYDRQFPSLDNCDTIHSTLVMRFARRHNID